jgi:hypothetical protein
LEQLRQKLTKVLNSIPANVIASICGWDYINTALLSATSEEIGIEKNPTGSDTSLFNAAEYR